MPFVVKFQYQSDIRRVTTDKPLTWTETSEIVKNLFELSARFTLKYKDEDGDLITVSTDRELEEAFRSLNDSALRFTVAPVEEKKTAHATSNVNENEHVIDIDVGALLPVIQDLIQTFAPQVLRSPRCGRFAGGRHPQFPTDAHVGVSCDGCGASPIRGIRWKCLVCPDYDLCEKCDKEGVHREHPFNKITEPINYFGGCPFRAQHANVNNNSQEHPVVHSAVCDVCNKRISGIRYKCSVCPDYDLCEKCEQSKETSHPVHPFTKITSSCQGRRPFGGCSRRSQSETKEKEEKPETTPVIPLRPAAVPVPIPKKEEKPAPLPETNPVPSAPLSPVPEPKKEEQKPAEQPKPVEQPAPIQPAQPEESSFQAKLKQLQEMGFADNRKNLEVLVKHKGDMIRAVMDLLHI